MPRSPHSPAALAEARQIVTRPGLFVRLFPDDAMGLRSTAWEMLKEDHAARVKSATAPGMENHAVIRFPLRNTLPAPDLTPGDAA